MSIFFTILIFICGIQWTYSDSMCGDWIPYKDEKCFKLFSKVTSQPDALNACHQQENGSTLITIKTKEEQELIDKILNASGIADNVWTGIKKVNNKFKNTDETELVFTNWLKDRPVTNKPDHDCVELSTDDENYGKWIDEKCQKQNAVLCEKSQAWSNSRIQSILLETRTSLKETRNNLKETMITLTETRNTLTKLLNNPVPIGFIYVQLFNQSDPKKLWSNTQWKDVTTNYAGLFFRAEGEGSASFGQVQPQNNQNIEIVTVTTNYDHDQYGPIKLTSEYNERPLFTGSDAKKYEHIAIKVKYSQDEIRPKNTAMRIWQRIK